MCSGFWSLKDDDGAAEATPSTVRKTRDGDRREHDKLTQKPCPPDREREWGHRLGSASAGWPWTISARRSLRVAPEPVTGPGKISSDDGQERNKKRRRRSEKKPSVPWPSSPGERDLSMRRPSGSSSETLLQQISVLKKVARRQELTHHPFPGRCPETA